MQVIESPPPESPSLYVPPARRAAPPDPADRCRDKLASLFATGTVAKAWEAFWPGQELPAMFRPVRDARLSAVVGPLIVPFIEAIASDVLADELPDALRVLGRADQCR